MRTTQAQQLKAERRAIAAAFDANGRAAVDIARMNAIDAQLRKLAHRRNVSQARREFMFDMNGHHGQA